MGEIVNLNRARKVRDKATAKADAATNRVAHGLSKARKQLQEAERARATRRLDAHKRED